MLLYDLHLIGATLLLVSIAGVVRLGLELRRTIAEGQRINRFLSEEIHKKSFREWAEGHGREGR